MREKPCYKPLIWSSVILCFFLFIWIGMGLVTNPRWSFGPDFAEYWAAGRINIEGGNPYDPEQLLPKQIQTGAISETAIVMWNPPWMLAIAMPFGSLNYAISRTLWLLTNTIIIFICVNMVWHLYGGIKNYRWIAWVIGFTFVPVLDGLKIGQTSALLLLGVVGFLFSIARRKVWLASIFLSLLAIKPHLLYLFFIAVFFWSVDQKQWKIILGVILTLTLTTIISLIFNPNVIHQFLFAINNAPPVDWATPTIGGLLRILLGMEKFWLQFIPPILGFIWLIYYWLCHRNNWDWLDQAPILILVSTLTAAYGWSWDQTVSIVPILQIAVLILPLKRSIQTTLIIITYFMINVLTLVIPGNQLFSFWLAPALLIWYLASMRSLKKSELHVDQTNLP